MPSWFFYYSYLIVIPALIAFVRFKIMDKAFRPLAYNLWIGVITEITATLFRKIYHNNLYVYNIFNLLDFVTFYWLFNNWGAFDKYHNWVKKIMFPMFSIIWVLDNIVLHGLGENNIIFVTTYSLFLALIGIGQLGTLYTRNNRQLFTNPFFCITVAVIFYYLFSMFISLFNSPIFNPGKQLWKWNTLIYVIINIFTNIMFAISLLWTKKKVKYI